MPTLPFSFPFKPQVSLAASIPLLRALNIAGGVVLCWVLAGLLAQLPGWGTSAPALSLPAPASTDNGAGRIALAGWFAKPGNDAPASATDGLSLVAVIAGKQGVALLAGATPTPSAYRVGEEVRPGLRLQEVLKDKVVLERGGQTSELAFPTTGKAGLAELVNNSPTPSDGPRKAPTTALKVSRGQLVRGTQQGNLADWDKGLASFSDGGIRVVAANAQPLARTLHLRDGDIIKQVNGRDLKQVSDISLIYHFFSLSSDVDLSVLRDGKSQQLHFKIEP